MGRGVLNFDKSGSLYKTWKRTHGLGKFWYTGRTRFITLREARGRLERNDIKCRWIDDELRSLDFAPARRFPWPTRANRKRDLLATRLRAWHEYTDERESQPFRIKTKRGETEAARDTHHGTSWYDSA